MKNLLETFLLERGLVIVNAEEITDGSDSELKGLSKKICEHREILIPLLNQMAVCFNRSKNQGRLFFHSLGNDPVIDTFLKCLKQQEIVRHYEFVNDLERAGFWIIMTDNETLRRYIRFEWAEKCVRYMIARTIQKVSQETSSNLSCRFMANVKVASKDDKGNIKAEFDLVAIVNKRIYVFETKSGPWIRMRQWLNHEDLLGKDAKVILCTTWPGIPPEIFKPEILLPINVLESGLSKIIKADLDIWTEKEMQIEACWAEHDGEVYADYDLCAEWD